MLDDTKWMWGFQPIVDYFDLNKRAKAGIDKYEPSKGYFVPDSGTVLVSARKTGTVLVSARNTGTAWVSDRNSDTVLVSARKACTVLVSALKAGAVLGGDPVSVRHEKKKKKKKLRRTKSRK